MRNLLDISAVYQRVPKVSGIGLGSPRGSGDDSGAEPEPEPMVGSTVDDAAQLQPPAKIQPVSLAKLVAYTTARPMDKRYQISDWGQRPLLQAQREYAALDARALLTVVSVLGARIGGAAIRTGQCTKRQPWAVEVVQVSSAQLPTGQDFLSKPNPSAQ